MIKHKRQSCHGKQKFLTKALAAQRLSYKRWHDTHQYRCTVCGYWHNGNSETYRMTGLAIKKKLRKKLEKSMYYDGEDM